METNMNQFKKLLIMKKSKICKSDQVEIIDNLFDCFLQYGKDMLYIYGGQISRITSRKAFETIAEMHLITTFEDVEIKSYDKEKDKYRWNIKISDIFDTLSSINSYDLLKYESDLFLDKQIIDKDSLTKTITVTTNKLHIKKIDEPNIIRSDYMEIIKDYKNHFPYFDEFLKLIIDMRLAKDRKASFLHLRVKSNWGKSFLSGLLKKLQIGFEIDYHNLMNKGANDIAPIQIRNSFVLILDEFNNFSSEMKKLSHEFQFAPKFGMKEEVELYLKLLLSAEKSPSFSGGVDEQIVNRVMVMDIPDEKSEKLDERKIYKKHGNAKYMSALERYTFLTLQKHLKSYLELGKFEAHKKADIAVKTALLKYKMSEVSNLNDEIKDTINEAIKEIINSSEMDINPKFREIKKNIIEINTGIYNGKIFIKQPKRTLEIILKNSVSESDYKKMKWKLSDLNSILNVLNNNPIYLNGKTQKGLVIDISENRIIEIVEEDKNRNIIKNHSQSIPVVVEDKKGKVIKNDVFVLNREEVS